MCYSTLELPCRVTVQYMYVANECLRMSEKNGHETEADNLENHFSGG